MAACQARYLGDLLTLIAGEGAGEAGVDGVFHRRKILPAVNAVAPVIQAEIVIQLPEVGYFSCRLRTKPSCI